MRRRFVYEKGHWMEYLRRFLWFFATRLMLLTLIVALLIVGFYMAMNSANIYVLLTDGLTERAEVIIDGAESTQLGDFFEQSYLQSDQQLIDAGNGLSVYEPATTKVCRSTGCGAGRGAMRRRPK